MLYRLSFILLLALSNNAFGQDSTSFNWKEIRTYDIDSNEVWAVDRLENVFISNESVINKYDTTGVLKFSQSIKSLGKMQQLVPINTMKLVHFSQEQQTLCYLDNTLSSFDDCIELADKGIVNAELISASSRPEMIWVFDNLNSKLILLPLLEGQQQRQEIENLKGVLDIDSVSQILERKGQLHVVERGSGVYVFDLYGSLLEFREIKGVQTIDSFQGAIIAITDEELVLSWPDAAKTVKIPLPKENIIDFKYMNEYFFIRTSKFVHKFTLELTK